MKKHHAKVVEQASRAGHPQARTPTPPATPPDAATRVMLDHVHAVHTSTRQQLDVLRKTRGQRNVGTVEIPAHLRSNVVIDDAGVETRSTVLQGVLPFKE